MKKGLIAVLAFVVLVGIGGIGAYAYMTAPTKGPTQMTPPPRQQPKPLTAADQTTADAITLGAGQTLFQINSASSVATFTLNEVLRGNPKTVVGTSTGMIAGQIGYDKTNPASSTIGTIKLNARTFVTDEEMRNNTIRRMILKTEDDANEFITFKPTLITGATSTFTITGDLTIAGVTKPVTFNANTTLNSDGTLSIHASTTVKRGDFNLVIPNFPFLANVQDEVVLNLNLIATP
jgi:polyisoprenoid-binding protein YceI